MDKRYNVIKRNFETGEEFLFHQNASYDQATLIRDTWNHNVPDENISFLMREIEPQPFTFNTIKIKI